MTEAPTVSAAELERRVAIVILLHTGGALWSEEEADAILTAQPNYLKAARAAISVILDDAPTGLRARNLDALRELSHMVVAEEDDAPRNL